MSSDRRFLRLTPARGAVTFAHGKAVRRDSSFLLLPGHGSLLFARVGSAIGAAGRGGHEPHPDSIDGRNMRFCSRVLGELHRDLSYLMMGKGVSVAGADREEAPGPKPEPTGREPGSQA